MAQGGCLCGAVRFEVREPLTAIELCHCPKCRRAYGSGFAATLYAERAGFRWTAGAEQVRQWDAPLERTPPAYRHCFCARCGGALPITWDDAPDGSLVEIPASVLDRDTPCDAPAYHIFVARKAPWHVIADRLPRHVAGPPRDVHVARRLRG